MLLRTCRASSCIAYSSDTWLTQQLGLLGVAVVVLAIVLASFGHILPLNPPPKEGLCSNFFLAANPKDTPKRQSIGRPYLLFSSARKILRLCPRGAGSWLGLCSELILQNDSHRRVIKQLNMSTPIALRVQKKKH